MRSIGVRALCAAFVAVALGGLGVKAGDIEPVETPSLLARVEAGELPPVAERLPQTPRVVVMDSDHYQLGRHGGQWRMLVHRSKDVKMLSVYGYARLVTYAPTLELLPDIAEDIVVEDGRIFTFKLRKGHKWSDGHPFTSEDFRYYWEDVANNRELSPAGPPRTLRLNEELPKVEILDEITIRYSWSRPNPFFLPAIAGAAPLFIYRAAHYLKQFHQKYKADSGDGEKTGGWREQNWAAEHNSKDNLYKFDNPELPTLQPWLNTTSMPAVRFLARRNPYFHRVDPTGKQLPYIDEIAIMVADSKLIPAKAGAGEVDLQARGLNFNDFTFLKDGEKRNNYKVRLWRTASAAHLALYPNLNCTDEVWRTLFRDVRFRRALSLGVNRHEINQVMYYGLAVEGNNTVLPQSPLFKKEYRDSWAQYDPERANVLLDEIGLTERNGQGMRLLPDGRPLEIVVETAGEDTEQSDVLELIRDSWAEIGVRIFTKPSQRQVFRNRIYAGETHMSIWSGFENGLPTAKMSPGEFAPTKQHGLQWPKWGQYYETSGMAGEPPDMAAAIELMGLYESWLDASEDQERERLWHEILKIHAANVFTIGLIGGVLQPVLVRNTLRNVPNEAIYNWDPGAHFGMYMPDTFWFDE